MKITKLTCDDIEQVCGAHVTLKTIRTWIGKSRPHGKTSISKCGATASYKIGRKYYCRKHAAYLILDKMTNKEI